MPTSPEGVAAILEQLSRVSHDLGRYAIALEGNTQAVSELREEMREMKERMNQDAILQAKRDGREEAERESNKRKHTSEEYHSSGQDGLVNVRMTMNQVLAVIGALSGVGAFIRSFWKDIVEALSSK